LASLCGGNVKKGYMASKPRNPTCEKRMQLLVVRVVPNRPLRIYQYFFAIGKLS
jgi:hypothetical protein